MTAGGAEILFAYDGSPFAREAIAQAGRLLRPGPAVVLTVVQPVESIAFGAAVAAGGATTRQLDEEIAEQADRVASEGMDLAREAGFDAKAVVEPSGPPIWQAIIDVADRREAGLIVLGSHGRSGMGYVVKGSVATAVSQHTKRAVMIAHSAAPASTSARW